VLAERLEKARKAVKDAHYAFVYGGWDDRDRAVAERLSKMREELRRMRDDAIDRANERKGKKT
jgi:hypothetical protein